LILTPPCLYNLQDWGVLLIMRRLFVFIIGVLPFCSQAQELVRVNISQFTGAEVVTLDSATNPTLFTLDPRIASVELTAVNPASPIKNDRGAATYQPSVTPPLSSAPNPPGFIQLTITPMPGETLQYGDVRYTVAAVFASNPSSLQLVTSDDSFVSVLQVINLDQQRSLQTTLPSTPTSGAFTIRWAAGDDFGDNGGGEAGFVVNDVVVTEFSNLVGLPQAVPTVGPLGLVTMLVLFLMAAVLFLRWRPNTGS